MSRVILFLPPYSGPVLGPPVGLLCLASPLLRAGYEVRIIDCAVDREYQATLEKELPGALCLGISFLTGPMINAAAAAAKRAKAIRPDLPIVFGGWHPSLLPDQTLAERFVDVVVRNQGELTFLEVVQRIRQHVGPHGVPGCSFRSGDTIVHNPDRAVAHIDTLPPPAYWLADFDAYERAGGERKLPYASSVGCPYACNYCTDTVYYKRRFNAHGSQRVVDEVTDLVARYRIREVAMLDSNFLVDTQRAMEIARGFLASGRRFCWTFQASTDLLCRLTDEEVRTLGESGLRHIGFGVESGSQEVLQLMNKRHQHTDDVAEAARKCAQAGIRATFNLIFGFPGETEADRKKTLALMGGVASRFDNATLSANIFTPYPGLPIWSELRRRGLREPDSMLGWSRFGLGAQKLPWLEASDYRKIRRSMSFFELNNEVVKAGRRLQLSRLCRSLLRALQRPLHWRITHNFFRWPIELWIFRAGGRLALRRSLLTGQALGHGMGDAC